MDGRITDEAVAQLRARIGVAVPHPFPPHYRRPNADAFRHVAESYGDDNPLWFNDTYATKSRWDGIIAPPPMVGGDTLIGQDEVLAVPDHQQREQLRGDPLRGVHAFYASSSREWWAPLRPDRTVFQRNALVGVLDKESEFAGRAIHEWTGQVFRSEDGTILGGQYRNLIRTERTGERKRRTNEEMVIAPYTAEEIEAIDAKYDAEEPRGSRPRMWEDVHVGDALGPMVKGPLTITDMMCWHVGMGTGLYGVRPLRLARRNRIRIPRFYSPNSLGVPDVQQRVHWETDAARAVGNPAVFDYGRMRETWLAHLCTDWMGDDAWLWKLDCEFRRFNFVGDTQWVQGKVSRSYLSKGDRPAVDIDLAMVNQRNEVTSPGHATILLPSRAFGPIRLPDPPGGATTLEDALAATVLEFDRT
jgi:hypothetical protein